MDNLDILKPNDGEEKTENTTFLEFEVSEQAPLESGPSFIVDTDKKRADVKVELVSAPKEEKNEHLKEEFSIPDVFDVANQTNNYSDSYVETPAAIRPTYLPRFTEVSDTYRMQDDPRPRPKTDTNTVKVEKKGDVSSELDPTNEHLEEKPVEKVKVTSTPLRNPEPKDETLTVLKFSTPIDTETQDATEIIHEPVAEEIVEPEVIEQPVEEAVEEPVQEEISEEPKNTTIPDPDITFHVVDFASDEKYYVTEEPLGASDSDKKDKNASNSEFNAPIQRDSIKDRFLDSLMSIKVRLVGALILFLVMVMVDSLNYFGVNVFASVGLGNVAVARAVVDMQFSICIFLFTIPELIGSFKLLLKGKFTPELINVCSLLVIIINDLAIAANRAEIYLTFGVLYGLQCLA